MAACEDQGQQEGCCLQLQLSAQRLRQIGPGEGSPIETTINHEDMKTERVYHLLPEDRD